MVGNFEIWQSLKVYKLSLNLPCNPEEETSSAEEQLASNRGYDYTAEWECESAPISWFRW